MNVNIRGTYCDHWAPKGQEQTLLEINVTRISVSKKKAPYDKIASVRP
jgi:hypothetical protein